MTRNNEGDRTMNELLASVRLCSGLGVEGKQGCWMAALSQWVGQKWTDNLDCVDPSINRLCICINDSLSDKVRDEVILPRLFDPIGTVGTPQSREARLWHLIDASVRRWAADAMELAKLPERANKLRGLPKVTRANAIETAKVCREATTTPAAADAAYATASYAANSANSASASADASADAAADAAAAAAAAANADAAAYAYAATAAADGDAAAAAAYAYAATARDKYIIERVLPVLDELIAMGPHAAEEPAIACEPKRFLAAMGSGKFFVPRP